MERIDAMRLLKLEENFSEGDVKAAHRRLAKEAHPDTGEMPNPGKLATLREAREALLRSEESTTLVTRGDLSLALKKQGELTRILQRSEATVSRVVMHHVGKLAAARNRQLTLSGLGTLIGLLTTSVGALARADFGPTLQRSLVLIGGTFTICSLMIGALALFNKEREERLRLETEEAGETLTDRGALAGTLTELSLDGFFTREDLQESIFYWSEMDNEIEMINFRDHKPLSRVAAKIGSIDFARLLLAKGLESGMLEEAEETIEKHVHYGYRRTFDES